ncbi:alpha-ketoglutarate-dependent dioxygenase AlkB family protein [Sphingobacterium sp. SYP-B4668]|uniref:alpha-ketoglutarate-dependent dioxygenase AlkB family protein n=1 Tax=Sphingobacterium sp. SYP-B4668 TaxID=2996035 RepID=UPI0022DD1C2A|nr:alpha-ketoglutarate-dependent dioxygenase AlkB [Sphingobacterium sp. SYP-B4668]
MHLFDIVYDSSKNILPYDGEVYYYGRMIEAVQADHYYSRLLDSISWRNDEAVIFGKHILTKRKVAWYGDLPFSYTYSNITKSALPWTDELLELKNKVQEVTGEQYNSCLLNLYHNGEEGMAWHSDGEKDLKKNGAIASMTFGAERKFAFKHKDTKQVIALELAHGSILVMKGITQSHWLHRLPPSKKPYGARINLTFRTIEA